MASSASRTVPNVVVPRKLRRAPQPSQRVRLIVGVLRDARHRQGMEHLEQQCAEAADQHGGEIGMDQPGHPIGWQVGLGRIRADGHRRRTEADGPPDGVGQIGTCRSSQIVEEAQGGARHHSTEGGGTAKGVDRGHR